MFRAAGIDVLSDQENLSHKLKVHSKGHNLNHTHNDIFSSMTPRINQASKKLAAPSATPPQATAGIKICCYMLGFPDGIALISLLDFLTTLFPARPRFLGALVQRE